MTPILLAVSLNCLFSTLIYILLVAIVVSLIVWVIGYLGLGIPDIIIKLIVVLGVVICIWFLVVCLTSGHPIIVPGP
jgi:hypothetical protein